MNDKTSIYADSYDVEPNVIDEAGDLEERRKWKQMSERKKLGILLREEKSAGRKLQSKFKILEVEHRELTKKARQVEALLVQEKEKNALLQRKNSALDAENQRLRVKV